MARPVITPALLLAQLRATTEADAREAEARLLKLHA